MLTFFETLEIAFKSYWLKCINKYNVYTFYFSYIIIMSTKTVVKDGMISVVDDTIEKYEANAPEVYGSPEKEEAPEKKEGLLEKAKKVVKKTTKKKASKKK